MEMLNIIIAALFVLMILFVIFQVFLKPIKLLWKILINSAVGFLVLFVVNFMGAYINFIIPINILSVLIVGFLGLPGLLLLVCLRLLMM